MDDRALFARVLATIHRRLGDSDLSVEELAREMGMSRSHLHRRLVRSGETPAGRLIRQTRLARAAALLASSDRSVGAVARAVGYPDPAHFTRAFKRELGATPSEWRARERPVERP